MSDSITAKFPAGPAFALSCWLGALCGCGEDQGREFGVDGGSSESGDEESGGSEAGETAESGDGDGDGDGDGEGDGDGDPNGDPVCGDGVVEGEEACDDAVNDGSYGGCNPGCGALGPHCGDGELSGPEQCDDANSGTADGCLGNCLIPRSCREILEFDPNASDGIYVVAPKSADHAFATNCDMTTDGGGWTQISLPHLCNGDLDAVLTAIEPAGTADIDPMCRPYTRDGGGSHSYVFDVTFLPGFDAFYLSEFVIKANSGGGYQSEINPDSFVQTSWDVAHAGPNDPSMTGDVSFGSADDAGPVVSYAALLDATLACGSCEAPFPGDATIYGVGSTTTLLRIGWGETGGEAEGWYPWWSGSVYLR
jgi:cysteine-rich repeat protein